MRRDGGPLIQGMVGSLDPGPSAVPDGFVAESLSGDGSHLIFGSTSAFEGDAATGGDVSIYDRNLLTGATHVVSKTPGGANLETLRDLTIDALVSLSQRVVVSFGPTKHNGQAAITPDEFVDGLPKTLTGKIRRIELRRREAGQPSLEVKATRAR